MGDHLEGSFRGELCSAAQWVPLCVGLVVFDHFENLFISHMFLAPPSLKQGNAHLRWFNISSALTWNRHFGCLYPWPVHHPQERAGGKDQTMDVIVVHQSDRSVIVALAKPYKDWRQLITCFQDRQTHIYIYTYTVHNCALESGGSTHVFSFLIHDFKYRYYP